MKMKLFVSWIVLLAGAVYGANLSYSGQIAEDPLVAALVWGYLWWALYWGVPVIWRWWWRVSPYHRSSDLLQNLFWLIVGLFIPLVGGYFYGVFGGAIYECLKAWWRVRQRA